MDLSQVFCDKNGLKQHSVNILWLFEKHHPIMPIMREDLCLSEKTSTDYSLPSLQSMNLSFN